MDGKGVIHHVRDIVTFDPSHPTRRPEIPGPVQARAADPIAARDGSSGSTARRSSTSAPTIISAWPIIPAIVAAAHEGLDKYGYGLSQVRFICGTQELAPRAGTARSPSFSARTTPSSTRPASTPTAVCSRRLLGEDDAIISDELNHASIIDGIRLCKAKRLRYKHADMADLERCLKEAQVGPAAADRHRRRLFDGRRPGPAAGDLRPGRQVRRGRDDRRSHATGLLGPTGRGTAEASRRAGPHRHHHQHARQDARRRASAASRPGRQEVVDYLRQRSRPYLFSNRCRRRSSMPALQGPRAGRTAAATCATGCTPTRSSCAPALESGRLHAQAGPIADPAGDARRRGAGRRRWPTDCWKAAST